MAQDPQVGTSHTLTSVVTDARIASQLAEVGETLPRVFATPFMIADMERACAALLAGKLGEDEVSVGVEINVTHTAPTPAGAEITVTARFTGREGALYWFDVWGEDGGGRIGEGRIARAILPMTKLMARAEKRR